jgi:hypothetical protein
VSQITSARSLSKYYRAQLGAAGMNFIERGLGVAPDGGNGWLEWILLAAGFAVVVWIVRRRDPTGRARALNVVRTAARSQSR